MNFALARFIASGHNASFRIPYITLDHPTVGLFARLGELSEHGKARFMVAAVRHAWDAHVRYDLGSTLPTDILAFVDALLDRRSCTAAELRTLIDAFQHVHDCVVAEAECEVPGAVTTANLTYVIGAIASWMYHALVALERDPLLTWPAYSMTTRRWLPFWKVLHGAATCAPGERAWQIEAARRFVDRPPQELDPTDGTWLKKQMDIGSTYLALCVAPWDVKRELVEQCPEVVDPVRRNFAKLVMQRASEGTGDALWPVLEANDILLDWCDAVIADATQLGRPATRALDTVFHNAELRALVESAGAVAAAA